MPKLSDRTVAWLNAIGGVSRLLASVVQLYIFLNP